MRYLALATDYDGTLAKDGIAAPEAVDAIRRMRESGRKAILVTGRVLDDLRETFDALGVFDRVVAENGAVLLDPSTRATRRLADPPPDALVERLREDGVDPLLAGEVMVATREPYEREAVEAIKDLGLELQVIFNRGAVMILPASVNKATGLAAALAELRLSAHNVVGIGDAENDHAFLEACDVSVAVANALPSVKDRADHVTSRGWGDGVVELVEQLIDDDLAGIDARIERHDVAIGTSGDGVLRIKPYRENVLLAGPSGSGKSTLATAFVEHVAEQEYQFCLIDPEGDYEELDGAVVLGTPRDAVGTEAVLKALSDPEPSVVVNLLGVPLEERPTYFARLLPDVQALRAETGRPHWLVVDEAHHLLPEEIASGPLTMPSALFGSMFITVHPERVARDVLERVDVVLAPAKGFREVIEGFAEVVGADAPDVSGVEAREGDVVAWRRAAGEVLSVRADPPKDRQRRHVRKYAEGDVPERFVFTGPDHGLNLEVQNLALFVQIASGLDDETWLYHLRRGDYSAWFRDAIKDTQLAEEVEQIERELADDAEGSRDRIRRAIDARYTLPA
jgi:hydroxymethylpyrimidine pyrophosphatase-like HAD family hydrolase/energy-coupling factor transporter ATP-binding protein EcfA2